MSFVHRKDIASVLKKIGCHIFIAHRGQIQYPMEEQGEVKWVPMGVPLMTNHINFTVKPVGVSMANFRWPPLLEVHARTHGGGEVFHIKYRIGGPGTEALCGGRMGCKKPIQA